MQLTLHFKLTDSQSIFHLCLFAKTPVPNTPTKKMMELTLNAFARTDLFLNSTLLKDSNAFVQAHILQDNTTQQQPSLVVLKILKLMLRDSVSATAPM